ncbi:MarR family winged helix-turn-helix transcriptional regulator [Sporosalibacterium faouarense]|uniref:MarR family winged helix-turn-helix transcriptional regulator n=1 Tax=Sporosalibacterium faouarense TaxID=516123 RepID=UPI00141C1584|nr:MarR family transcriptional regulator [Sporosalibacterium faouarense]MTI46886.1 MarR family transcriptional regulator [Bacillota bacterium]
MLKKADIELIERVSTKTQKKLNEIFKGHTLCDRLDNLTRKELQTMFVIGSIGNKTMGEIADKLGVTISTPTTTIDRLIKKGYVERKVGKEDRRQVLVSLTEKGLELHTEVSKVRLKNMELLLGILSDEEMKMFRIILGKLDNEL